MLLAEIDLESLSAGVRIQPGDRVILAKPAQVMLDAIRDHFLATGVEIAMKPAGGIRTAKQALQFLIAVKETLGDAWLNNARYRFGASALLNDLTDREAELRRYL